MTHITADRVKESSTTTGTGNVSLSGTTTGYRTFASVASVGDTMYYTISHTTADEWEVGYGTYSGTNTLTRTTVIASSNTNSLVSFTSGDKDVFITVPAAWFNQAQIISPFLLMGS